MVWFAEQALSAPAYIVPSLSEYSKFLAFNVLRLNHDGALASFTRPAGPLLSFVRFKLLIVMATSLIGTTSSSAESDDSCLFSFTGVRSPEFPSLLSAAETALKLRLILLPLSVISPVAFVAYFIL